MAIIYVVQLLSPPWLQELISTSHKYQGSGDDDLARDGDDGAHHDSFGALISGRSPNRAGRVVGLNRDRIGQPIDPVTWLYRGHFAIDPVTWLCTGQLCHRSSYQRAHWVSLPQIQSLDCTYTGQNDSTEGNFAMDCSFLYCPPRTLSSPLALQCLLSKLNVDTDWVKNLAMLVPPMRMLVGNYKGEWRWREGKSRKSRILEKSNLLPVWAQSLASNLWSDHFWPQMIIHWSFSAGGHIIFGRLSPDHFWPWSFLDHQNPILGALSDIFSLHLFECFFLCVPTLTCANFLSDQLSVGIARPAIYRPRH